MKNNRLFLWIIAIFLGISLLQNWGGKGPTETTLTENDLGLSTSKTEYSIGKEIRVTLQNNTDAPMEIASNDCPDEPLTVLHYTNDNWIPITASDNKVCEDSTTFTLAAGEKTTISYKNWTYRLFSDLGRYRIDTVVNGQTFSSNEFTTKERGFLGHFWLILMYQPILNTLIFLIDKMPGHNLGLAIIILTLFIRTLLLIPSQRALRSQRKMQELQPKLEELKRKHKDNQEKLALETMNLWKTYRVNPFGSCLMMFVQIPILIALYQTVRDGLSVDKSGLLYSFISQTFSYDIINTHFFNLLELTTPNVFVLPLIIGGLQFIQMHLSLTRAKKKQEAKQKEKGQDLAKKVEGTKDVQSEMQMATNMMKYFMPVMIAFFTASLPSGVGLYWGTSTIYGIVQQIVVNKEGTPKKSDNEPTVRVIEKA